MFGNCVMALKRETQIMPMARYPIGKSCVDALCSSRLQVVSAMSSYQTAVKELHSVSITILWFYSKAYGI